jgi:hypothetical protein
MQDARAGARRHPFGLRQLRRLGGLALIAAPFAGCFAEPKAGPSSPSSGDGVETGGTSTSSGGRKTAAHAGAGGRANQTGGGLPSFGGVGDDAGGRDGQGAFGGETTTGTSFKCQPATAQPLPARKQVTSASAPPPVTSGPTVLSVTKAQLFDSFSHSCGRDGACHVGLGDPLATGNAMFRVTVDTFDQRPTLGDDVVARIGSSNADDWMPPDQGSGAKRGPGDPFYDLGQKLLAWQKAKFSDPLKYTIDGGSGDGSTPSASQKPYLLNPTLAKALTNIGSCIPNDSMPDPVMTEMQQKDAFFAGMETSDDLPDTIYETDLVSLDSGELAKRRVFSYAPTYPLYSDSAGKMRYIRVPIGQTLQYDESQHDFTIPDNTRFYKTFLKPVVDKDGNAGYRKMETRLIVVRQDTKNADGSSTIHALRASYAWDEDEQMAHLVKDPRDNGSPWADRLCPYVTDERSARDPNVTPISNQRSEWCRYMTEAEMADSSSGLIRHYAIPSSDRCDQCHMGSSSHSYILGFTPWQADRRAKGEGGIYEDPNDDELTQLQRFIDYGVVSGIKPGGMKLEESQLPRTPRNDYELTAQAYMMGNCAFCHNDHGYPVVTNPVLRSFVMFPSPGADGGGVFQFPLEKYSPRAKGGVSQTVAIPYITAGFGDFPPNAYAVNGSVPPDLQLDDTKTRLGTPLVVDWSAPDLPDWDGKAFTFLAPWRSLIWRNVYTPFTYNEDGAIYIHMPRNSSGFDCRAPKIMANWMLSIPVEGKPDFTAPNYYSQPVQEVSNSDPTQTYAYGQAVVAAKKRLSDYAASVTGAWCPSDDDIVDANLIPGRVVNGVAAPVFSTPPDNGVTGPRVIPGPPYISPIDHETEYNPALLKDMVPDHFSWIPTDASMPTGQWVPRRSDWQSVIVDPAPPPADATLTPQEADLDHVVAALQDVRLSSDLEQFALEPLPMGFWDKRCQDAPEAANSPTGKDLGDGPRIPFGRWLMRRQGTPEQNAFVFSGGDQYGGRPNDRVHFQSRGEAVVHAICQNCHGRQLDSKSALAATISELTGGETRVANFVSGLFGPPSAPGAYARDEFTIGHGADPEDWHARYVLFMGLGGTRANLPQSVLNLVATSPFYGAPVTAPGATSPNMLGSAKLECQNVLSANRVLPTNIPAVPALDSLNGSFARDTGHFELWESLCTHGNDPIVRVLYPPNSSASKSSNLLFRAKDDAGAWVYPPNALVGDQYGDTHVGIDASNLEPWCLSGRTDQEREDVLTWAATAGLPEESIPFCPDALFATVLGGQVNRIDLADSGGAFGNKDFKDAWVLHGAINAGLSAFYYIRGFLTGTFTPALPYDFCAQ